MSWGVGSSWGGLDFAPAGVEPGCGVSSFWATAAVAGVVVRAEGGLVVLDLDGDGREQTGWVLMYLHIARAGRVAVGKQVKIDDVVGHPSCEGGNSTGTHLHVARKYNGEWIEADGPLPFVLSGWRAKAGDRQYYGSLVKDGQRVTSRMEGARTSIITR
jgi:murein DD-endopeptidase MepM/ murein hydrolase activator NlpD